MFGNSNYLKEIYKIEKQYGEWDAMKKIIEDVNNNHDAFIKEDYIKVIDLYNKIDSYAKLILGNLLETYSEAQMEEVHYFRSQLNRAPSTTVGDIQHFAFDMSPYYP